MCGVKVSGGSNSILNSLRLYLQMKPRRGDWLIEYWFMVLQRLGAGFRGDWFPRNKNG